MGAPPRSTPTEFGAQDCIGVGGAGVKGSEPGGHDPRATKRKAELEKSDEVYNKNEIERM